MLHTWDQTLESGDAAVDAQHRELFRLFDELQEAVRRQDPAPVLHEVLDGLVRYVAVHFEGEERLMRHSRYPRAAEHKALHDDLRHRTAEVVEGYRTGRHLVPVTLAHFLSGWLWNHILQSDLAMVRWVREHGGPAAAGPAPGARQVEGAARRAT